MRAALRSDRPRVLWSVRSGTALRAARLAFSPFHLGPLKWLLWAAGAAASGWSLVALVEGPLRVSPWLLLMMPLLAVATSLAHELSHAVALTALGHPPPAIGVAYRRSLGLYVFTNVSAIDREHRARRRMVYLAGYDADAMAMVVLATLAFAAAPESALRGTLLAAHGLYAACTLLTLRPARRGVPLATDLGRVVRCTADGDARARLARSSERAWLAVAAFAATWLGLLAWRVVAGWGSP